MLLTNRPFHRPLGNEIECALHPWIGQPEQKDGDKDGDVPKAPPTDSFIDVGPQQDEGDLQVKEQEEEGNQIKLDRKAQPGSAGRDET